MADEIKIIGLDALQRTLEELPREVARKVVREGLQPAGEIVRQEMTQTAPRRTGFLSGHFNIKVRLRQQDIAGSAFIGPQGKMYYEGKGERSKGVSTGRNPKRGGLVPVASVARFLEFGTSKMPAHPFMRRAFESTKDRVLNLIISNIRDAIARFTK